ncbi:hypothetical protein IFM89_027632 [Coptis chinensis]|uniref:SUZ domain-containing protein n=1 Tax=Coptis chinensis TaxID=261450 RepID=A0A835IUD3_9MAGN|nr:hypothetical protein IFM89_027632 [Coptis chinensis]
MVTPDPNQRLGGEIIVVPGLGMMHDPNQRLGAIIVVPGLRHGTPNRIKDIEAEVPGCGMSQFLTSGAQGDRQWIVPITVCCGSYNARKNFPLQRKSETVEMMDLLGSTNATNNHQKWIKLNVDQTGFYRVKYDDKLTARLQYVIQANHLSPTDRFGILDDSFALFMACKQSLSSLFSLMSAYMEELEYTVLSKFITMSKKVARIAADASPELSEYIKLFLINLFQYSADLDGILELNAMSSDNRLLCIFGRTFSAAKNNPTSLGTTLEEREAAYLAARERIFSEENGGIRESVAPKPRNVPMVARRMIAHALFEKNEETSKNPHIHANASGVKDDQEFEGQEMLHNSTFSLFYFYSFLSSLLVSCSNCYWRSDCFFVETHGVIVGALLLEYIVQNLVHAKGALTNLNMALGT